MTTSQTAWIQETLRARRGHDFYPPMEVLAAVPPLYAIEDVAFQDKIIHLHYFAGGSDWWVAELDAGTGEAFGYARTGGYASGEWGYIDLPELERVEVFTSAGHLVIERDLHWAPGPSGRFRFARLREGRRTSLPTRIPSRR